MLIFGAQLSRSPCQGIFSWDYLPCRDYRRGRRASVIDGSGSPSGCAGMGLLTGQPHTVTEAEGAGLDPVELTAIRIFTLRFRCKEGGRGVYYAVCPRQERFSGCSRG
jgi:hypothetical protein